MHARQNAELCTKNRRGDKFAMAGKRDRVVAPADYKRWPIDEGDGCGACNG